MNETKAKMWRQRRRRQLARNIALLVMALITVTMVLMAVMVITTGGKPVTQEQIAGITPDKYIEDWPELQVELLDVNDYSRPGTALEEVRGIVIHYVANPGSTAMQNRDYFNGLKNSQDRYASSHFVIGLDGEIVQCIPCDEMSYASNERNVDTISIECCHEDETGKFNGNTYESLVELVAWLMGRYDLSTDDIIRHYDVTGKNCPKYFVEDEEAWFQFKQDVLMHIERNGIEKVE